jgi:ribosomal protein S21
MAISVDVPYGNVDKAWRSLTRKVREEQYMVSAQGRQFYIKPSERRKLAASASEKKRRKEHFRCVCSAGHLGVAVAWRPAGCCLVAVAAAGRPASLHWASS